MAAKSDEDEEITTAITFQAPLGVLDAFTPWTQKFGNYKASLFHRLWMRACTLIDHQRAWIRDLYQLARTDEEAAARQLVRYLEAGAAADQLTPPPEEVNVDAEDRKRLDALEERLDAQAEQNRQTRASLEEKLSKLTDAFDKVFGGDAPEGAPNPGKKPKGSGGKKR